MDYFEQIVAKLIEKEGKWVKQNVKVDISGDYRGKNNI